MKITEIETIGIIEHGEMPIYVCPKCDEVLTERDMGKKCPACDSWTYGFECRRRFYHLIQELKPTLKGS